MTTALIALYPGFTALDAVGPYQMLAEAPGVTVELVAEHAGPVADDRGTLSLVAGSSWNDHAEADVVIVPGGPGTMEALRGGLVGWLQAIHPRTSWTASVCSGSLILGAAGLLRGLPATSHYLVREQLTQAGAIPVDERVVLLREERIITAAGVASGIDMALRLVAELVGRETAEAVQLWTEYAPEPPFSSGRPDDASEEIRRRAHDLFTHAMSARSQAAGLPGV